MKQKASEAIHSMDAQRGEQSRVWVCSGPPTSELRGCRLQIYFGPHLYAPLGSAPLLPVQGLMHAGQVLLMLEPTKGK